MKQMFFQPPTLSAHYPLEVAVADFIRGPLSQSEARALNPAWMLDIILGSTNAEELGRQLDPTSKHHHKIVRGDQVTTLLGSDGSEQALALLEFGRKKDTQDDQSIREFLNLYMRTMSPLVVGILDDTLNPDSDRKQLPKGLLTGLQGRLNLFILLQDVVENRLTLSKEEVAQGIVENKFTSTFFQPLGLAGALMTIYSNSPARMMLNFLHNHPNPEWAEYFQDLELRHFAQVDNLWSSEDRPQNSKGWIKDKSSGVWINIREARLATREVIHGLCGIEFDYQGPTSTYISHMTRVIETLNQRDFDLLPGRFGRTYASMRHYAYSGSIAEMMTDFLQHHPNQQVRHHFRALQPYHFPSVAKQDEVSPRFLRSYEQLAFEELFRILTDPGGPHAWSMPDIPERISAKIIAETPLLFGSTAQVFALSHGSNVEAVMLALRSHSDLSYRKFFADLRAYHFKHSPHDLWSMEQRAMPDTPHPGWQYFEDEKQWKNIGLARTAMDEFFECLFRDHHEWEWNLELVATSLTLPKIEAQRIKYKANLGQMIHTVYFDSAREAINDYLHSDLFTKRVAKTPRLQTEIESKWGSIEDYLEFATKTLQDRRGHREIGTQPKDHSFAS